MDDKLESHNEQEQFYLDRPHENSLQRKNDFESNIFLHLNTITRPKKKNSPKSIVC